MQNKFILRGGAVLGREHGLASRNRQDGYALKEAVIGGKRFWLGAVSDGCGQGKFTEVAGILLPVFAVNMVIQLLRYETPLPQMPTALYPHAVGFLEGLKRQIPFDGFPQEVAFVQDYLLTTLLGFVVEEDKGVVFWAGGGYFVINDEMVFLDDAGGDPYPGYHLVPRSVLKEDARVLPSTFDYRAFDSCGLKYLAIATDGFSLEMLKAAKSEAFDGPLGLQLWLNFINGPRNFAAPPRRFFDDAAMVELAGNRGD